MSSPASDIEAAVSAFRREHALVYLKRLSGQPVQPRVDLRALRFLQSEPALELLARAHDSGELDPTRYAAVCAHVIRARLEASYAEARNLSSAVLEREAVHDGDSRPLAAWLREWCTAPDASVRERAVRSAGPALEAFTNELLTARSHADGAVAELARHVNPPRHPDAGPETGSGALAEQWLALSEPLTREALAFVRQHFPHDGRSGLDGLRAALGQELHGVFPRDGRNRRLAADWEPLALRQLLAARARAAPDHRGPFAAPHVIAPSTDEVRISASALELGAASELASAEAVGRALGHLHASAALPMPLRFASAATVSRSVGGLAVQRLLEPGFLRKVRGLGRRESETIARLFTLYVLLDCRLAASAVLARQLRLDSESEQLAVLGERALLGPVDPGPAGLLLVRISAGAVLRARAHAPALAWSLRERFDADWYLNPRSAEPIRGALSRAGAFSVEGWTEEMGTTLERGVEKLAELF